MPKPIVLVVLDGWGLSNSLTGNAILEANLPTFDILNTQYPMTALQASGISVGLPWNTPGNSEVGHMTMGAGRVMYQNLPRITMSIEDKSFFKNPAFIQAAENARSNNTAFHIMGLFGDGSVHSYRDHLAALLRFAKQQSLTKVYVHLFTDGRDSTPLRAKELIPELTRILQEVGTGSLASLTGRHYAMDRNQNWDRIESTYRMLTQGSDHPTSDPVACLAEHYAAGITDEYIPPTSILQPDGPLPLIQKNDSVVFFNFREDRARELTHAFTDTDFSHFERSFLNLTFVTMVEYEQNIQSLVAYPPMLADNTLGECLSRAGLKQLRVAETEKYAHVTYFFNGGHEEAFPGEDRKLIPSQTVPHFDDAPEMSAPQITDTLLRAIESGTYDFILVNYANPDMVGHTGNEEATVLAVEATDKSLSHLIPAVLQAGGELFITADHGNAEEMKNIITNEVDTEHSLNPVPLWYVTRTNHHQKTSEEMMREQNKVEGLLSDVAPTILELFGIEKPAEMTGESLLSYLR